MNKLMNYIFKIKSKKFYNGLEEAQKRANKLYSQKSNVVICAYCGKCLNKAEAAAVYDIEHNTMKYSHEDCWQKNNKVYNTLPIPKI